MMILFTLLLAAQPAASQASADQPPLSEIQQRDLRCAAAFAIVASEQQRGEASALAYPPLGVRGKRFFADTALKLQEDNGLSVEAVRDLLIAIVADLQSEAQDAADPNAVLDAVMTPCLAVLNDAAPAPPPPDVAQCMVYLQLAYEEVYRAQGLSPAAQDLKTLASVLESRARDAMRAEGLSGNESDLRLAEIRAAILARQVQPTNAETAGDEAAEDIDYATCFDLAAPESRKQEAHS